jgi:methionine-rich copper-binding protein CopC
MRTAWTDGRRRAKRAPPSTLGEFRSLPLRFRSRRAILAGAFILALSSRHSEAHAILEASQPAAGATVPVGSVALKLRFNSRIDRTRSRLTLTKPDQDKAALPIDLDGPPDILSTTVTLTPGAYSVRWQVLAVDGHITRGDLSFTVSGN